jgi:putative MATE family efflux protein
MAEKWNNRALFRLLWPLVIEQLLAVTMGIADTAMVTPLGEFAVSGVNIIDNINNFLTIIFIALSTGGSVVCSQYLGRQDYKNSDFAAKQLIYAVIIVSLVITGLTLAFRGPIIGGIYGRIEADVMNAAIVYFLVTALSFPALAVYNACAALYRATGNSQVSMRIALMVNIINVGGNAFFLYVMKMGVAGVALSTLLSRIAAAAALTTMLVRNRHSPISLSGIGKIKVIPSMLRRILNIGVPTGLESSMFQLGRLLTQRVFAFFGTSIIAANAIASLLNSFCFMPGNAFCIAVMTVAGQCIGAGDYEAAKKHTVKIGAYTWLTLILVSGALFVFRTPLIVLFKLTPEAQAAATGFLAVPAVTMAFFWTPSWLPPAALRAAGDARYVMIVGIASMWIVRVCFAYLLTFTFGIGPVGVWLAMGADFVVRSVFFVRRWKSGKWMKIKVIGD